MAISVSKSGRMRIYNRTTISSLIKDEEWTTLLNFKSKRHLIQFPETRKNLHMFECPFEVRNKYKLYYSKKHILFKISLLIFSGRPF